MAQPTSNYQYLLPRDMDILAEIVKSEIKPEFKERYREFVPFVASKVDKKIQNIVCDLMDSQCNYIFLTSKSLWVSNGLAKFIHNKLAALFQLTIKGYLPDNEKAPLSNDINNTIFPDCTKYKLDMLWSPSTNFNNKKEVLLTQRRYIHHPAAKGKELYAYAKSATQTDLTLICNDNVKIPVHKLMMTLKSPYFERMLKSGFKEGRECEVQLPHTAVCLQYLVQFIYEGEFHASSLAFEPLQELFMYAHEIEMTDLFDYCVDLMMNLIEKRSLTPAELMGVLNLGFIYNVEEFKCSCLHQIEQFYANPQSSSSAMSATDIDWDKINKRHYVELLRIAAKNGFSHIEEKLSEAIDKSLAMG